MRLIHIVHAANFEFNDEANATKSPVTNAISVVLRNQLQIVVIQGTPDHRSKIVGSLIYQASCGMILGSIGT